MLCIACSRAPGTSTSDQRSIPFSRRLPSIIIILVVDDARPLAFAPYFSARPMFSLVNRKLVVLHFVVGSTAQQNVACKNVFEPLWSDLWTCLGSPTTIAHNCTLSIETYEFCCIQCYGALHWCCAQIANIFLTLGHRVGGMCSPSACRSFKRTRRRWLRCVFCSFEEKKKKSSNSSFRFLLGASPSLFFCRLNCAEPFTYLRFIYYAQQP